MAEIEEKGEKESATAPSQLSIRQRSIGLLPEQEEELLPSKDDVLRLRRKVEVNPDRWDRYLNPQTLHHFGFSTNEERFAALKKEASLLHNVVCREAGSSTQAFNLAADSEPEPNNRDARASSSSALNGSQESSSNQRVSSIGRLAFAALRAGRNAANLVQQKLPYQACQASFERRVFFEDLALFHYCINGIAFPGESRNMYPLQVENTSICLYMLYHFVVYFGGFEHLTGERRENRNERSSGLDLTHVHQMLPGMQKCSEGSLNSLYTLYQKYLLPFEKHIGGASSGSGSTAPTRSIAMTQAVPSQKPNAQGVQNRPIRLWHMKTTKTASKVAMMWRRLPELGLRYSGR
eukprot:gb/GECG01010820.1/.p1 GENE.gb/GECG01010820.1/~~gb/GECG01010820.1/.p1  ORF type:complete len:350 (+),score=40.36 gb/GECG01010820.1/:1-1050(+)